MDTQDRYKLVEKAFRVWHSQHHTEEEAIIYHAKTKSDAKEKYLKDLEVFEMLEGSVFTSVDWINAEEEPNMDWVIAFEKEMTRIDAFTHEKVEQRKAAINACEDDELFYYQNGYAGNGIKLWIKDSGGHTSVVSEAQKYTKEQALWGAFHLEIKIWKASDIHKALVEICHCEYLQGAKPIGL